MLLHTDACFKENYKSRYRVIFLAFSWLLGILFGISVANVASLQFSSLMCTLFSQRVSIVWMLIIHTFPLLLSAVLMHFSAYFLLFLFAFLKSFCYAFSSYIVYLYFGSAGWLLQSLLMFSGSGVAVVLLFYWFRTLPSRMIMRDTCICCIITVCFVCVDYFLVSPFLESLF